MMVVLGTDAHKRSHTVVATDEAGRQIGTVTVAATAEGHLRLVKWWAQWPHRLWAIEDCRALSRRLEADLLRIGERVVRVPPKMMAGVRRSAGTRGKSDPIDALAVARAALREPDLPVARLDGPAREVRLLVDYRESLVKDRTAAQNRLRWRLHELAPGFDPPPGSLNRFKTLAAIDQLLDSHSAVVADLGRREVTRIRELTREANQLEADIAARVTVLVPSLLAMPGCGALSAAKLVGEAADIGRFKSRDAYAMWAGTAPIPVWSANNQRFRLNRGGNRQTNAALHRIAVTQARMHPDAQAFITRRLETGSTKREALRLLKRRLANVVYRTLLADTQQPPIARAALHRRNTYALAGVRGGFGPDDQVRSHRHLSGHGHPRLELVFVSVWSTACFDEHGVLQFSDSESGAQVLDVVTGTDLENLGSRLGGNCRGYCVTS